MSQVNKGELMSHALERSTRSSRAVKWNRTHHSGGGGGGGFFFKNTGGLFSIFIFTREGKKAE